MIVIDTHALIWFIQGELKIGPQARALIESELSTGEVRIPAIIAWEVALIEARGKVVLPGGTLNWIHSVLDLSGFSLQSLVPAIAVDSVMMDWSHKDPADRIIVATARHLKAPLLTADSEILDYAAAGHLQAIDARH